jgi:hypothetical protein
MKYLLLVCWDSDQMNAMTEPEPGAMPRRARSVRVRDGKRLVTDGPFSETKEAVGGFDLIEADSLEQAVEIAADHPVARIGTIEVRPLWGS